MAGWRRRRGRRRTGGWALCGINGAIGYGIGALGAVALPLCFGLGLWWQERIRDLMGISGDGIVLSLLLPRVAAATSVLLIGIGRLLRQAYRWLAEQLSRWIGHRAARAVGWLLVAVTSLRVRRGAGRGCSTCSTRRTRSCGGTPTCRSRSAFPRGHGHRYFGYHGDAWAEILRIPGWTDQDAERLRSFVTSRE